ncbi:1-phosphatidylinositol 4-kinase, putative [Babesia bigemina]|uniref:1-phosphatidylinositol 4-kinase, putative n=1 Tax=Babesia bigemina TaxID=5866 RepID=A0A061D3D0_BABBI|nr:1-phosphatidylinositol 4-kinase, putative [Babesia bigemina]CDR95103.1 1-phosphatidylinositol 4-kinase, putative [Babesia bigemina]|eukprot:XP_012767289.1 1-phosphatidylinositol 4-kinase, putative [Babesia bigemina]
MNAARIADSYLAYKRHNHGICDREDYRDVLPVSERRRTLAILHPEPTADSTSDSGRCEDYGRSVLSCGGGLRIKDLFSRFESDFDVTLDQLTSHIFKHLITNVYAKCSKKRFVKLCRLVCAYLSDLPGCGLTVRRRHGRRRGLSRLRPGLPVSSKGCSRTAIGGKRCILSALRICLYLKGGILGFRLSPKYMMRLVRNVVRHVDIKLGCHSVGWVDVSIIQDGSSNAFPLLKYAANVVANVLCHKAQVVPAHVVLQTSLCLWPPFHPKYTSQMAHILLFMDYVLSEEVKESVVFDFRAAAHESINRWLLSVGSLERPRSKAGTTCGNLYALYAVLNRKHLFQELSGWFIPHIHMVEYMVTSGVMDRTLLSGCAEIRHIKWIVLVCTQLLTSGDDLKHRTWLVIQTMTQFFLEGGVKSGLLRCSLSATCFRCLINFVEICSGFHKILTLLRKSPFYAPHVHLVKMLLKNEMCKLHATFRNPFERLGDVFGVSPEACQMPVPAANRNTSRGHYTPRSVRFAAQLIRKRCLEVASQDEMNPKIRQHRVDTAVAHPVYLKLLCAVDRNVSNVKVTHTVEAVIKGQSRYVILEHLAFRLGRLAWLPHELSTSASIGSALPAPMSMMSHLYLHHYGLDDILSILVVQDHLNVVQRTQACHVLSENMQLVAMMLPQLVQSLSIDPGDRIWHLLSASLKSRMVRERLPYFLACMLHNSEDIITARKAASFLDLIVMGARASGALRQEIRNISMHSNLLNLSSKLATFDVPTRPSVLVEGLRKVNESCATAGKLQVFDDSLEKGAHIIGSRACGTRKRKNVRFLNPQSGKVLTSATRAPFMVDFCLQSDSTIRYIYKMADDMRQDALVVQVKLVLLHIFRLYNLEAYLQPFLVVPYSTALFTLFKMRNKAINRRHSAYATYDMKLSYMRVPRHYTTVLTPCMGNESVESSFYGTAMSHLTESSRFDASTLCGASANISDLDGLSSRHEGEGATPRWFGMSCLRPFHASNALPASIRDIVGRPHILGGIVGFISGTISRHNIGKEYGGTLEDYFLLKFGPRGSPQFDKAMENFVNSLAGYSLLCFLLQVKDRHNGNLLISPAGHILHIDFGFILGASPAADVQFEHAPFKLTKEMTDLLGGVESDNFRRYVRLLVSAYMCVRQESTLLIALVKLLQHSGLPCFRRSSVITLQQRLYLDATPERAAGYMLRKIHTSLHNKTTMVYDMVQAWQQGIEH